MDAICEHSVQSEGLGVCFGKDSGARGKVVKFQPNELKFKENIQVRLHSICYFALSLLEQLMDNNKNINNQARFINWAAHSVGNEI